jgi:serine/threonine-protein kinase
MLINPERWHQIESVLQLALERAPDQRSAFLAEACGDDEALRCEVESLIATHEQATSFLETPLSKIATELFVTDQALLAEGTMFGSYKIETLLGTGGMGVVYLAEDLRLGRRVALKLLPSDFTTNTARLRRFEQEARSASSLNYPNILTIYEFGETDNIHFIACEFIEGVTLRERMNGELMQLGAILDVAAQVASALSAAHAAGIVHRDIKPENIMLRRDDLVKVLDFGLATLTERLQPDSADAQAPTLFKTDPDTLVGTAIYMSPEQARGLNVDARTDIWSLGVVLYEMMAGCLPFTGSTSSEVLALIMNERESQPLNRYSREVPAELERIISKALCKNRDERYQSMKDMLLDLKTLREDLEFETKLKRSASLESKVEPNTIKLSRRSAAIAIAALLIIVSAAGAYLYFMRARSAAIESIAVLPFVNASGDSDIEYLSDGLTESLITSLSQLPRLSVKGRGSVVPYKGKDPPPRQVGKELNVQAVLNGRVVQHGNDLTLHIELVDVNTETALWKEDYNRSMTNLVSLPGEIARDVASKLRLRLSGTDDQRLAKNYTANPEAYQLYLKGRYYWNKRNEESLKKGIDYFQQALSKDPNYALAYSGLADSYSALGAIFISALPPRVAMQNMKAAALKAVELDDTLAEAHTSLADAKFRGDWDWAGAEREFKRALELNPNYAEAHEYYSQYLVAMGRFAESIAEGKRGQSLEPVSPRASAILGLDYYFARQDDQAIEECQRALDLDPNFLFARWFSGLAYANKSMSERAIAEAKKAVELSGHGAGAVGGLGYVYATLGRRVEAHQALDDLEQLAKRRYVSPYGAAAIHARLGDKDAAFEWLEKAYQDGAYGILFLKSAPEWDGLRSEPRFQDIMRRVGLPQ